MPRAKVNTEVAKYSHIQERASDEQTRAEVRNFLTGLLRIHQISLLPLITITFLVYERSLGRGKDSLVLWDLEEISPLLSASGEMTLQDTHL